ncbi:Fic family protein [Bordetella avium]|uniref:Fido domain-containing protein n=1 Tax=Bordetella avium (strain 197N) TaxID=360910 RepID=Q2KZH0_BORA1|nr:Fic family protein [Bordetella avium]CAJ47967.1 conserved hypothetical protein [Bordetella avium 197N]
MSTYVGGTTPTHLFFQLKRIFHILESLGSARIEGNHTTLSDYVEHLVDGDHNNRPPDQLREIDNIERAMDFIDGGVKEGEPLSEQFIRELHHLTVNDLEREGDRTPGAYRLTQVSISKSKHLPPPASRVAMYMQELVDFVNRPNAPKYDLMKVALAHHRFGWIHPFSNGNGRVVRLLTYAMLLKYGFNVSAGNRILNPTAVFCNNRDKYYQMLGVADQGTSEGLEHWCCYVLGGILAELKKVDRLSSYEYLRPKILRPAIRHAIERGHINKTEENVLLAALRADDGLIKAKDLEAVLPNKNQRTYQIKKLVERGMLVQSAPNARSYYAGFANNFLLRGVMKSLAVEGFLPDRLDAGL